MQHYKYMKKYRYEVHYTIDGIDVWHSVYSQKELKEYKKSYTFCKQFAIDGNGNESIITSHYYIE